MVYLILKGSITYKLFREIGLFFSGIWSKSTTRRASFGLLAFLRSFAEGSVFCRTIGGFFNEEAGLKHSIFYKVFTYPFRKTITWSAYLIGDGLDRAASNSRTNAVYRRNKSNLQRNGVFYISLFASVLCLSSLLTRFAVAGEFSIYYAAAFAITVVITLFTASSRLKYFVVNSFLYRFSAKSFWEFWNEY